MTAKTIRIKAPTSRERRSRALAAKKQRDRDTGAERRLAELTAGDTVRPVLTLVPSREQLPDAMLEAGAKACFESYTNEAYGDKTVFQSPAEELEMWEARLKQVARKVIRLRKGIADKPTEREPVPKVIPYTDQAQYIKTTWRRIAQRTYNAMEKAK